MIHRLIKIIMILVFTIIGSFTIYPLEMLYYTFRWISTGKKFPNEVMVGHMLDVIITESNEKDTQQDQQEAC